MKFSRKDMFNIPNIMTYIRLLCVPFFVWIILDTKTFPTPLNIYIAFGIFMFASITDMADGFIARRFNLISDIGKVLDPIADKLLQVSTLLCLMLLGHIPLVFPLIFFIKESYMVLGGSCIVKIMKSDYVIQSNFFGKSATWLNSLGIVLGFFVGMVNKAYDLAVIIILSIAAAFAIITAMIYTYQFVVYRKAENIRRRGAEPPIEELSAADSEGVDNDEVEND